MSKSILFFGTPPFAAQILERLLAAAYEVRGVVTQPPRPQKRSKEPIPSAVAEVARQNQLPLLEPEKASDIGEQLADYGADLFVVVAYGEILRKKILEIPPLGCLNIHASLLPKYRGAAPIQRALIDGEAQTGISLMYMVREMDAGDLIATASTPIDPDENLPELEGRLCTLGADLLMETLPHLEQIEARPQDPSAVTFAPKITSEECEIKAGMSPEKIHNLVRGVAGRPGAWCWVELGGKRLRLKVHRTQIVNGKIDCLELQLEGRRRMSGEAFARGFPFLILPFT